MSERGAFRGRGGRGGGGYGSRGGRGGNQQHGQSESQGSGQRYEKTERERPKKENILNLAKYMDQKVRVKFSGGREGWLLMLLLRFSKCNNRGKANEKYSHWFNQGLRSADESCS